MQPERVRVICLLCPEGQQATFQQGGGLAGRVVQQWLGHVEKKHPDDAAAARGCRIRTEKFIDGIGDSAAQHRVFVNDERLMGRQIWESGVLALDDVEEVEAWILKHCGRVELKHYREARQKRAERAERVAQGLVHVYRCELLTEAAFKVQRDVFRMTGKIRGMHPKHWLMLIEDPSPEQLQDLQRDGTVTEVDPDAHL